MTKSSKGFLELSFQPALSIETHYLLLIAGVTTDNRFTGCDKHADGYMYVFQVQ